MQSYFNGLPFESNRKSTLRGAGNVSRVTIQSGNPYPQNLLLYKS
jgi:hypothetical protein